MELTFCQILLLIIIYLTLYNVYQILGQRIYQIVDEQINRLWIHRTFYMKKTSIDPSKRNVAVFFHGKFHGPNLRKSGEYPVNFVSNKDIVYTFDRDEFTDPDYVTDLSKDDALNFIPTQSFNIIYLTLCACCTKYSMGKIRETQAKEILRILKNKGIFAIKRHSMYTNEEWNTFCTVGFGGRFSEQLQANVIEDKLFLMKAGVPLIPQIVKQEGISECKGVTNSTLPNSCNVSPCNIMSGNCAIPISISPCKESPATQPIDLLLQIGKYMGTFQKLIPAVLKLSSRPECAEIKNCLGDVLKDVDIESLLNRGLVLLESVIPGSSLIAPTVKTLVKTIITTTNTVEEPIKMDVDDDKNSYTLTTSNGKIKPLKIEQLNVLESRDTLDTEEKVSSTATFSTKSKIKTSETSETLLSGIDLSSLIQGLLPIIDNNKTRCLDKVAID